MSSFANLKRGQNSFDKLTKAIEATTTNQTAEAGSRDDPRMWQPSVDKAGNGMAIIRFLPAPAVDGDDGLPWVRVFNHGFQGPGGWLIDNCLTTINNGKCPVCEHNSTLWNSGIDANKNIARNQKRKLSYYANVYIVSDPSNKENEGQIKIFKFGKKIFDKITEAMNPEFPDEKPINPFDLWEGANFKLKIRNVESYRNYDKSEFDSPVALFEGDDTKLEELWKKEYSLKDFHDAKNFKSYEQIKTRLDKVLGLEGAVTMKTKAEDSVHSFKEEIEVPAFKDSVDDDDMDYFKSLAEKS
jgi:hypothetical protein